LGSKNKGSKIIYQKLLGEKPKQVFLFIVHKKQEVKSYPFLMPFKSSNIKKRGKSPFLKINSKKQLGVTSY